MAAYVGVGWDTLRRGHDSALASKTLKVLRKSFGETLTTSLKVQTGVERDVSRVQVTSRHGDFGGASDNPVSIMWYDVGNTFLGSYVDETMWNGSPERPTVLSNLGAAS